MAMGEARRQATPAVQRVGVLLAVAITGVTTLAAQVLVPRTLHPLFGSSGDVGAAVVAMSLAGLSLGYFFGGRLRVPALSAMAGSLGIAAVWLVGLSQVWPSLRPLSGGGGTANLILVAALVSFVPSLVMGSVSPLAVAALATGRSDERPAARPSIVFGLGTLGNVVGGLLAGFVLVPFVGLTTSLLLLALVLAAVALLLLFGGRAVSPSEAALRPSQSDTAPQQVAQDPADESGPALPTAALLALAFYSGIASLAIEVSGARLLASSMGPTITLWASILTVSLGGLAIGYFLGGLVPAVLLRMALPVVVITNCFWLLLTAWIIDGLGRRGPTQEIGEVLGITVTIFGPAFVLFGIESILVVALLQSGRGSGRRTTDSTTDATSIGFAASAVGGFLGALTGVFHLLPELGVAWFIRLAVVGYLAATAWVFRNQLNKAGVIAALAVGALIAPLPSWRWPENPEQLLTQEEGRFQTIRVYSDQRSFIRFHLGPTFESQVRWDTRQPTFGYSQTILNDVGDVAGDRVLVIGGAGHALARAFESRGATVTEVEVDPNVARVSDEFFGAIAGDVVITDGRRFVTDEPDGTYDLIILDAFDGPRVVPPHLTTQEFFTEVLRILTPDGRFYMNMIGNVSGDKNRSYEALSSTVAAVFPEAARFGDAGNIVLIAGREPVAPNLPPLDVLVDPNTDDLNPIDLLTNLS